MNVRRSAAAPAQPDIFGWLEEQEAERERILAVNSERSQARGFVVIATDPEVEPTDREYREVFATEARTPAQAVAKVRPKVPPGRRLRAYLATGTYKRELPNATWVR